MSLPLTLTDFLEGSRWGKILSLQPVGGGCINNAARLTTERGPLALLKTNEAAPKDMFAREAEGLQALAAPGAPRVPQVFAWGEDWILLEFLKPGTRRPDFWTALGNALAVLHSQRSERFGFAHDNYLGSTPQPNPWTSDGYEFFAEHRLRFQGRLARSHDLMSRDEVDLLERVVARLRDLIPSQPASLLHGDLWGGNVIVGPAGEPVLIDPAAHYGWPEAELAMTSLFGGFDSAMYTAYETAARPQPGYRDRFPIYNLYHLLNHLNLFGEGYHAQVVGVLRRFG